jgi:hypothetical protein
MAIAQMVLLVHKPAPKGMVADPDVITTIDPSWDQIRHAVAAMGNDHFMLIVSSRLDFDAPTDPDALVVEYGEGHGFMLYQQGLGTEIGSTSWRTKSAEKVIQPSTITPDQVLGIIGAYNDGSSFDNIASKFPDL